MKKDRLACKVQEQKSRTIRLRQQIAGKSEPQATATPAIQRVARNRPCPSRRFIGFSGRYQNLIGDDACRPSSKAEGDTDGRAPEVQLVLSEAEELALPLEVLQIPEVKAFAHRQSKEAVEHQRRDAAVAHEKIRDAGRFEETRPMTDVHLEARDAPHPAERPAVVDLR